jgi:uncharacterized membrane protein
MADFLRLFGGTVLLRPYVFTFLLVYLVASVSQLGWRRTLLYLPVGYSLAWMSEFSSIHWGFPYGDYFYIPHTVDKELWVAGVPFMDSLSYVFLSYCSYATAIFLLSPLARSSGRLHVLETHAIRRSWRTLVLGACLFVLLDIIIDPVALQGHRWFLGQIYGYRQAGLYFGVPMSNFYGWLVVGLVLVGALQLLDRWGAPDARGNSLLRRIPGVGACGPLLYIGVLGFNLTITFWIGEYTLGLVGCVLITSCSLLAGFFTLYKLDHVTLPVIQNHLADFPDPRVVLLLEQAPRSVDWSGPTP